MEKKASLRRDEDPNRTAERAGQLLVFLREQGCIAYYERPSGVIEAIAPHLFEKDENAKIRTLIEQGQSERPGVIVAIEE